jgi:hypothetical protein
MKKFQVKRRMFFGNPVLHNIHNLVRNIPKWKGIFRKVPTQASIETVLEVAVAVVALVHLEKVRTDYRSHLHSDSLLDNIHYRSICLLLDSIYHRGHFVHLGNSHNVN